MNEIYGPFQCGNERKNSSGQSVYSNAVYSNGVFENILTMVFGLVCDIFDTIMELLFSVAFPMPGPVTPRVPILLLAPYTRYHCNIVPP